VAINWGPSRLSPTAYSEEFLIACVAVRITLVLLESALAKGCDTEGAHKVLRMELVAHGRDHSAGDRFVAGGTERAAVLMVVHLTVGPPLVLVIRACPEPVLALVAREALDVPLLLQRRDDVVDDGFAAAAAFGRKHLVVVALAVGAPFEHVVLCSSQSEGDLAVHAHEVFWMPRILQRCYAFIYNRLITVSAPRRELRVIILSQ